MDKREFFPDGTPIDAWFYDTTVPELNELGRQYVITDHGVKDDGRIYTNEIQKVIDRAAEEGGGVIVVPEGTYRSGALYFKKGVDLYVAQGGVLMGSDDISDYPVCETRMEGETCMYFPALVNADNADGFTICGSGVIDGNGLRAWRAFWLRREWNRACTNKDEQRPRLLYISNSSNVTISGVTMQNSHYWTSHLYRCDHVRYLNCRITSPAEPVRAPSTDAIDLDVCTDVLIKGCYFAVNDDSVVLKGGKGPWADTAPENGMNERIIVEDCSYGFCHGCLTCGSESVHNRNIIVRRVTVDGANNMLWLKMRPDTPQKYEYVTVENVTGNVLHLISIHPWKQFFDLKGRTDMPVSVAENITLRNCDCDCDIYFNVESAPDQYRLKNFTLSDMNIRARVNGFSEDMVENVEVNNVSVDTNGNTD